MGSCMLGLYEKALPDTLAWADKLAAAKEAGFDYFEISIDETDCRLKRLDYTREQIGELWRAAYHAEMPVYTMCLSGHRKYPLGSGDSGTERRSLEIMEKAVDFAALLGIRIIQLAGYDVYYEESTEQTRERFLVNLKKCVELAARKGIILAFETMENEFMNTIEKARYYVEIIDSPYLKIYPDIGNVTNSGADPASDIAAGRGCIAAAHLKETRPGVFRNLRFGDGRVDFPSAIRAFREGGVRMFTAEFWYREGSDWRRELSDTRKFFAPYLKEEGEGYGSVSAGDR